MRREQRPPQLTRRVGLPLLPLCHCDVSICHRRGRWGPRLRARRDRSRRVCKQCPARRSASQELQGTNGDNCATRSACGPISITGFPPSRAAMRTAKDPSSCPSTSRTPLLPPLLHPHRHLSTSLNCITAVRRGLQTLSVVPLRRSYVSFAAIAGVSKQIGAAAAAAADAE